MESRGVTPQMCGVQKSCVCCTPASFSKKIDVMYGSKVYKEYTGVTSLDSWHRSQAYKSARFHVG